MTEVEEIQDYREKTTLRLVDKYKEIIDKTFGVIDLDILETEIKGSEKDKTASEKKYLDKISNRRKALDQIRECLKEIENLEATLTMKKEEPGDPGRPATNGRPVHPTKRHAKTT